MNVLHGRAWVDGAIHDGVRIEVSDGVVQSVERERGGRGQGVLVPGFVDLHVHGAAGADFMDGSAEGAAKIALEHARTGTTCLAATTLSASRGDVRAAIAAAIEARRPGGPVRARIAGIHLEGPYIDPQFAGAQDRDSIRAPAHDELDEWLSAAADLPVIATVAPNVPGVLELIRRYSHRVLFSIGHTGASFEEAIAGLDAGARHSTHLFNAMTGLHHRNPGVVGAVLSRPDVTAELIADGRHLHPAILRIAAEALRGRGALITDAMRACGAPEGTYRLYGYDVEVRDGAARLSSGALAGSVLTMEGAVRNMVELCAIPLESVIPMATEVPARILGIERECGTIAPGRRADLVLLGDRLEVQRVWVGGREVT